MLVRKITLFFILLLLSFKIFAGPSTALLPEEYGMVYNSRKSVVKIISKKSVGTGFIVKISENKAFIITVAHVIEGDPNPKVEFFDKKGDKFSSEILYAEGGNSDKGLAILLVKDSKIPKDVLPLQLSEKNTKDFLTDLDRRDANMFTFGFPQGGADWAYAELTYSGAQGRDLFFSGNIHSGNSGGPLIKNDKVIGIITVSGQFVQAVSSLAISEFSRSLIDLPIDSNNGYSEQIHESEGIGQKKLYPPTILGNRVALVIGNDNYKSHSLSTSINDARDISQALKELGFDVILEVDVNRKAIEKSISDFTKQLTKCQVAIDYKNRY